MDPKYIAEVWQVMSVLSAAQELLGDESFPALDPGSSPGQALVCGVAVYQQGQVIKTLEELVGNDQGGTH